MSEFFVCEHHMGTGGYESCCMCSEDGLCTEYLERLDVEELEHMLENDEYTDNQKDCINKFLYNN